MRLATKEAAGRAKMPPDSMLVDQLGDPEAARQYKRWARDYPEVERGPDGDILDHYTRLKSAFERENKESGEAQGPRSRGLTVDKRPVITERAVPRDVAPAVRSPEELRAEQTWENFSPSNGLPTRIPGQYTTGNPEFGTKPFSGWELPPENQPLHTTRAPMRAPQQQSMQDWIRFLHDKGITLNHQLMRPDAVQMQGPMPQGQDIWKDFIGPTTDESYARHLKELPESAGGLGKSWRRRLFGPRKAASTVANSYIEGVLVGEVVDTIKTAEYDPVAAFWKRHNNMLAQDWHFHESGTGNYYEKTIDGKTHRITADNYHGTRGWTHQVAGQTPHFYDNLNEAVVHATTGKPLAGFSLPQRSPSRAEDESYSPEREERTRPVGNMVPPEAKGRYQTLSYSFRWEEQ